MAKLRQSSSASTNAELLKLLSEKYNLNPQPKAGVMERLFAPIVGIGSTVDAYHDARFQDKNTGILNLIKNYGQNVAGGFKTFATGNRQEDKINELSDILDKTSTSFRTGMGKNPITRSAIDIISGIATDPTTYMGLGAVGLSDDLVKVGVKSAIKTTGSKASRKAALDLIPELLGKNIDEASTLVAKNFGPEAADGFYRGIMNKGGSKIKSGALQVLGKNITENKLAVEGARRILNPAVVVGDVGKLALDKVAPEAYNNILEVFNKPELFKKMGISQLSDKLTDYTSEQSSVYRSSLAELHSNDLIKLFKKIPQEEQANVGKLIESTSRKMPELGNIFPEEGMIGKTVEDVGLNMPEGASKQMQNFLIKYFDVQKDKAAQMMELGLPTISDFDMGYIQRNTKGYKLDFLVNELKQKVSPDIISRVVNDKKVLSQIEKLGYVKRDTLNNLLKKEGYDGLKQYDLGELGRAISGGGAVKERVFKTLQEGEAAGVVYDDKWLNNIFQQTERQNEQIAASRFVQDLPNIKDDMGGDLFVEKPTGRLTTPVTIANYGTLYTDSRVAKLTEEFTSKFKNEEALDGLMGLFDKAMKSWKGWVTGYGPNAGVYHLRNAMDDTIRMMLDGHDLAKLPENLGIGMDVIRYDTLVKKVGREEAKKQLTSKSAENLYSSLGIKSDSAIDDLWNKTIKNGVFSDFSKSTSEMEQRAPSAVLEASGKTPTAVDVLESAGTLGGYASGREQVSRIAHFIDGWRKTGSPQAGIEATRRTLFNYSELTKGERELFARVVPFYSFVKNNMRFYLDELKNNPQKIAKFKNVIDGIESGTQGAAGEDWNAMPDFIKDQIAIPFGKTPEGELKVLGNLGMSVEGLNDLDPRQMVQNINPALKILTELSTGKNMFYNKSIEDVNTGEKYQNYPQWMKDLLGYKEYEQKTKDGKTFNKQIMDPYARYLLENTPVAAQLNTFGGRVADITSGGERALPALTKMIIPGTIYKQNIEPSKSSREKDVQDAIYKLLRKKGLADIYERFYIPKGLQEQLKENK